LSLLFARIIPRIDKVQLQYFWSLLAVFLFIPFIQFRYFWWTIPFLLYFIFQQSTVLEKNTLALPNQLSHSL
jgi:hypothetical protein